jgi:hypothetical protein
VFSLLLDFLARIVCYHRRLIAASRSIHSSPQVSSPANAGDPVAAHEIESRCSGVLDTPLSRGMTTLGASSLAAQGAPRHTDIAI